MQGPHVEQLQKNGIKYPCLLAPLARCCPASFYLSLSRRRLRQETRTFDFPVRSCRRSTTLFMVVVGLFLLHEYLHWAHLSYTPYLFDNSLSKLKRWCFERPLLTIPHLVENVGGGRVGCSVIFCSIFDGRTIVASRVVRLVQICQVSLDRKPKFRRSDPGAGGEDTCACTPP